VRFPQAAPPNPQLKACVSWGSLHALRRQDGGGFVQVVGARGEHRANKSRTEKTGFSISPVCCRKFERPSQEQRMKGLAK